ncbi:uncharacterized protein MYCFIDRAFT_181645 [Pseudocercospora fijiensis CIRAD86]|uniref:Uncharacterized protein n=1 Tax=Pseudocercospora fijiensis (strain CIRAD86) TaxID=383855 RepID=M2Z6A7_PSEFD|nr:uncharacterized protein MYCFIDRAFT_181645 [Pseudocercospora fijiensis CIRAD86]EME85295.1 hypothetical protein MYCFIDRAFT_181645 [Pseudocercospora fijiensis CIRAD86]
MIARPAPGPGAPAEYDAPSCGNPLLMPPSVIGPVESGVGVCGAMGVPICKDVRRASKAYRLELSERPGGSGISSQRGWMFRLRRTSNKTCAGGFAFLIISANR